MQKIFQEYGGVIMTVLAIVGIIGCIAIMFTPYGTGWMDDAFKRVIGTFSTKATEATPDLNDYEYYSSFGLAITDVNAGTIGENADVDKPDAVCGVRTTSEGETCVVFFKDGTETATTTITADVTIKLDGHKLSYSGVTHGVDTVADNGNTITIDGRRKGSEITATNDADTVYLIRIRSSNTFNVNYGTYTSISSKASLTLTGSDCIINASNCSIVSQAGSDARAVQCLGADAALINCTLTANAVSGNGMGLYASGSASVSASNCNVSAQSDASDAHSIFVQSGPSLSVADSLITAVAKNKGATGIQNKGTATITNCTIKALANYGVSGSSSMSSGVMNSSVGTMTLNNCYVMGTHSGAALSGTTYISGGTYESYGHGGIYFQGSDTDCYVSGATLRECAMPDGYTAGFNPNNSGFFVGSGSNKSIYMDNCVIYGSEQSFVLRDTSGEENNTLYISNSTINGDINIRIDNTTHKVYIGQGCNFTAEDATLPEAVVQTDEIYTKN